MAGVTTTNSYIGSVLLDFTVNQSILDDTKDEALNEPICTILKPRFGKLEKVFSNEIVPGNLKFGRLVLFAGEKGVTATVRTYPSRKHVTLTIEYDIKDFEGLSPASYDDIKLLERKLTETFQAKKTTKALPEIKRALDFDIYFTTSDDRLMEYDIKEMIFDDSSEFQHVQIGRSENYGNILILDDLVNLAVADLIYTESIMHRGEVDYTGKDVLILGGGDGALLCELRKEKAKSITMVEIDDMVMKACKVYLRKACEDTLDNYNHENYKIVVGDCIPFMLNCHSDGTQFDFIFGDLTDIPISPTPQGEIWDFFRQILNLSFTILKTGGTYFTHANGISASESLKMFENTVKDSLNIPVLLNQTMAFIPSFQEKWVFYKIQRKE